MKLTKENTEIRKECYAMAAKSANLYARIEPNVKEQAGPNLQVRHLLTSAKITAYDL